MASIILSKTVTINVTITDPELSVALGKATTVVSQAEAAVATTATQLAANADPAVVASLLENDWIIRAS